MSLSYSHSLTETIQERSWLKEAMIVLGASVIIALFAPVAIPLPFTPIPIGVQSHVILVLAVLLGSKRGALAVIAYIFQGVVGLPVFAQGKSGLLHLAGPSGGYILGYVIAAFVTGWLVERMVSRTPTKTLLAMALGSMTIFLFGVAWLSVFIGTASAFTAGVLPFLPGDFLKLVIGTKILKELRFFSA